MTVVMIASCTIDQNLKYRYQEVADTIANHISSDWHVYYQDYSNADGKYYVNITDDKDTLIVITDKWSGEITMPGISIENRPEKLKRYNLSVKRACAGDSIYTIRVESNKSLSVHFRFPRPNKPEHPLEDYGLTEADM